jgi:hypothetical protein
LRASAARMGKEARQMQGDARKLLRKAREGRLSAKPTPSKLP